MMVALATVPLAFTDLLRTDLGECGSKGLARGFEVIFWHIHFRVTDAILAVIETAKVNKTFWLKSHNVVSWDDNFETGHSLDHQSNVWCSLLGLLLKQVIAIEKNVVFTREGLTNVCMQHMHMHVCTVTVATLPCKSLIQIFATAVIWCAQAQPTSLNMTKMTHKEEAAKVHLKGIYSALFASRHSSRS